MKRPSHRSAILATLVAGAVGASLVVASPAQAVRPGGNAPLPSPTVLAHGSARELSTAPGRPLPRPSGLPSSARPAEVALRVASDHATELGLGAGDLAAAATAPTAAGGSVVRLQQHVGGVPVMGGEVVVDLDPSGATRSASSDLLPGPAPATTTPTISSAQAATTAVGVSRKALRARPAPMLVASAPVLVIFDPRVYGAPGVPRATLVWRSTVTSPVDAELRRTVLVDATTGGVVLNLDQTEHAQGFTVCDDANVRRSLTSLACDRGTGTLPAVRKDSAVSSGNPEVDAAYANAERTAAFLHDYLNRSSVNGTGLRLTSIVRVCSNDPADACPFDNAFWDGEKMVYGAGYAVADDVVGHELFHGVTQYTSNLFYYYQSGAINESLSDIMGEFVDQTDVSVAPAKDGPAYDWLLGEDLPGGAVRNMKNPTLGGQPDRTGSTAYADPVQGARGFDSGGVHTNSGVGNKFAYLLTAGGTFTGQTVSGIGIPKAADIIYEAAKRLTSGADYRSLAAALRTACSALVGTLPPNATDGAIGAADCAQVDHAVRAVQMDVTPTKARVAQAQTCPVGTYQRTLWADDMESPGSGRWQRTRSTSPSRSTDALWYYGSQGTVYGVPVGSYARSGRNELWGDDPDPAMPPFSNRGMNHADHRMSMARSVQIPTGATYVRFEHAYGFESDSGGHYDGGIVEYSTTAGRTWIDAKALLSGSGNNGYSGVLTYYTTLNGQVDPSRNPLVSASVKKRAAFVGTSRGYTSSRANLSSLAGRSVRIRFRIGADQQYGDAGWFVDNVRFYSCVPLLNASVPPPVALSPVTLTWGNDVARASAGATMKYRFATAGPGSPLPAYGAWRALPAGSFGRLGLPLVATGGTTCAQLWQQVPGRPDQTVSRCTSTPVDDRRLAAGGRWARARSAGAYLHTASTSSTRGARLTLARARGRGLAVVATLVRGGGSLGVYVGGRRVALLSLAAARTTYQRTFYLNGLRLTGGPVGVRVESTGKPVVVDGLAVRP